MDLAKVLVELRAELDNLDAAILSLEQLKQEGHRRRGRPPKLLAELRKAERIHERPSRAARTKIESEESLA
ncbi:MAG: hypothetical protein ACLQVN_17495 [Bryobacteraceae bacterium]